MLVFVFSNSSPSSCGFEPGPRPAACAVSLPRAAPSVSGDAQLSHPSGAEAEQLSPGLASSPISPAPWETRNERLLCQSSNTQVTTAVGNTVVTAISGIVTSV